MVNELGYTVTNASRDAGFVSAERHRDGTIAWLLRRDDVDHLTVSIFEDTLPRRDKIRVTVDASRSYEAQNGYHMGPISPSENAKTAASTLLATCSAS